MTAAIPLPTGQCAIVDDDDAERVQQHSWRLNSAGYVITVLRTNGAKRITSLHRFVLNDPPHEVDHRNRNRLDCRKDNLRLADRVSNSWNMGKRSTTTTSKYKGVYWHSAVNKWAAKIYVDRKSIHLGIFANEEDAARAYDQAARKLFGEFACPNF